MTTHTTEGREVLRVVSCIYVKVLLVQHSFSANVSVHQSNPEGMKIRGLTVRVDDLEDGLLADEDRLVVAVVKEVVHEHAAAARRSCVMARIRRPSGRGGRVVLDLLERRFRGKVSRGRARVLPDRRRLAATGQRRWREGRKWTGARLGLPLRRDLRRRRHRSGRPATTATASAAVAAAAAAVEGACALMARRVDRAMVVLVTAEHEVGRRHPALRCWRARN